MFEDFIFQSSSQSFNHKRDSLIMSWMNFYNAVLQTLFHKSIPELTTFIYQYFVWFASFEHRLILKNKKKISNCNIFLSFIGINIIEISITHKNNIKRLCYIHLLIAYQLNLHSYFTWARWIYFTFFLIFYEFACATLLLIFSLT